MIKTFANKETEKLFQDIPVLRFKQIERAARRKLMLINQAQALSDLLIPAGNRLEPLKGRRKGQYSIRINDQWRICFKWSGQDAYGVEIVDYH